MGERAKRLIRAKIKASGKHSVRIFLSNKHTYAQIVDPEGRVMTAVSSKSKEIVMLKLKSGSNVEAALAVGRLLGEKIINLGLGSNVAYDRSGKIYHGRVAAIAEGARQINGIEF